MRKFIHDAAAVAAILALAMTIYGHLNPPSTLTPLAAPLYVMRLHR